VYVGLDFPPATQDESNVYGLDFINDLGPGEQLLNSTWELTVRAGEDPLPVAHLQGPSKLITTQGNAVPTATIQRIGGLLPGVTYTARAIVETDFGNVVELRSHIYGEPVT
jgi:hypothetical protein